MSVILGTCESEAGRSGVQGHFGQYREILPQEKKKEFQRVNHKRYIFFYRDTNPFAYETKFF